MRILCVGEAMIELAMEPSEDHALVGVAGDVLNTAIYLKRGLGTLANIMLGSGVGTDAMSNRIVGFAKTHRIDCDRVTRHTTRGIGLYAISVDDAGERSFTYWRDNSAAREMFGPDNALDFSMLSGVDVILFSAITLAILSPRSRAGFLEAIGKARMAGTKVAFDSNYRPRLWENVQVARDCVAQAWALTDLGFPSIDDELALFGETVDAARVRLAGYDMQVCMLKRGADGPEALCPAGCLLGPFAPGISNVVDTTGAGDAFNGGFLSVYLQTGDIKKAAVSAHNLAIKVVGTRGAILPS